MEPYAGTLHAPAVPKRGGVQDGTDVPLRTGRHLYVHGVVTGQGLKPWRNRNRCAWQQAGFFPWNEGTRLRLRVGSFLSNSGVHHELQSVNVSVVAVHPQIVTCRTDRSHMTWSLEKVHTANQLQPLRARPWYLAPGLLAKRPHAAVVAAIFSFSPVSTSAKPSLAASATRRHHGGTTMERGLDSVPGERGLSTPSESGAHSPVLTQ